MARMGRRLSRSLRGRLDDLGIVAGCVVFGVGVWQVSEPAAWMFAGVVIVGLSVLAAWPEPRSPKGGA